jgi:hypothetical protein
MDLSSIEQIIRTRVPNAQDSYVELYLDSVERALARGGDYSDMSEDDVVEDFEFYIQSRMDEAKKPSMKMKKSELKEMIKAAFLSEADFTNAQDDDAALGGMYDPVYEGEDEEESLDDILARITGTKVDPYMAEDLNEQEEEEETDIEVDAEEETDGGEEAANDSIVVDKKIVSLSSLPQETRKILDTLETLRAQAEEFGDQKFITQVGNTITFFTRDFVVAGDEPTKAKVDESLEILKMKKLAGLLTEGEYAKALLRENEATLSNKEEEVARFILQKSTLEEDTLEEAIDISGIISRTKKMASKLLLTPVVVAFLLASTPQEAHAQIKDIAKTEAGINVNNLPQVKTKQTTTSNPIKQIQSVFKDSKSINTNPKNISKTDQEGSSLNWGASGGNKQASIGLSVIYDNGSPFVQIEISQVPGKSAGKYNQVVQQAKKLGKVENSSEILTTILVKKENVNNVISFLQNNVNNL